MNRVRHNQLALSTGYKLINEKRFTPDVEDYDDTWLTLKFKFYNDIRFKASCNKEVIGFFDSFELKV